MSAQRVNVTPLVKAGNVVVIDLGQERRNQYEAGFSPARLSPGVCVKDEGHTIRPVRSEGLARECKVVEVDLRGVEDAQVRPLAEEEPDMDCESDGAEDGEHVRLLLRPRTPPKAVWERHVLSHMPFRDWCRHWCCWQGSGTATSEASRAR